MLNECRKAVWVGALLCALAAPPLSAQSEAPRKVITRTTPIYPRIALTMQVSGTVKLRAVVTPAGTVKAVQTIGGSPLFVPAAEQAVRSWKYEASKTETTEQVILIFSRAE